MKTHNTSEPEPEIDLGELNKDMAETDKHLHSTEKELLTMIRELSSSDEKKAKDLQGFLQLFE